MALYCGSREKYLYRACRLSGVMRSSVHIVGLPGEEHKGESGAEARRRRGGVYKRGTHYPRNWLILWHFKGERRVYLYCSPREGSRFMAAKKDNGWDGRGV